MHSFAVKTDESYFVFLHLKTSQFCRFTAMKISPSPHLTASASVVLKVDYRKRLSFVAFNLIAVFSIWFWCEKGHVVTTCELAGVNSEILCFETVFYHIKNQVQRNLSISFVHNTWSLHETYGQVSLYLCKWLKITDGAL